MALLPTCGLWSRTYYVSTTENNAVFRALMQENLILHPGREEGGISKTFYNKIHKKQMLKIKLKTEEAEA